VSIEAMMAVLDRAAKDYRFNWQMIETPDAALAAFDLNDFERAALKSGERDLLISVGLDERIAAWVPWKRGGRHSTIAGGR
jgi:citrate lyase beta subunit